MASIDDELSQIERDIRTLKIEYEQYFGGGRKRPPADTQWRLDTLIRRYAERMADLNYGQRFRYNNLLQTYAKYQEMWRKKLVQKETGMQPQHFGAAAKAIEAARRKATPPGEHSETARSGAHPCTGRDSGPHVGTFAVTCSVTGEPEKIEQLYTRLIEARSETGEQAGAPSLQDFERFVQEKMRDLKARGARQVEYTVAVEGGRVKLKARIAG